MKKILVFLTVSMMGASALFGAGCSDKFSLDFTFFGAKDKSYVVEKNTFKNITSTFPNGKLAGATVEIDLMSLDTSGDLTNGKVKWTPAMAVVRDNNTKKGLFGNYSSPKGTAKIVKVNADSVDVAITMNGKTETISMATKVDGGMLKASGKLDVTKFSADAWKKFTALCRGFHQGKSWEEIDVYFSVPASCK